MTKGVPVRVRVGAMSANQASRDDSEEEASGSRGADDTPAADLVEHSAVKGKEAAGKAENGSPPIATGAAEPNADEFERVLYLMHWTRCAPR